MVSPSLAEGASPPKRAPVPSRRLIAVGFALLGLGFLAPLLAPLTVAWRAGLLTLLLVLGVEVVVRPRAGVVSVARAVGELFPVGRAGAYAIRLTNHGPRTLRVGLGETLAPALDGDGLQVERLLEPGETVTYQVPFVGLERGDHELPPATLRVTHPWGLLTWQERVPLDDRVVVTPGRPARETEWLLSQVALLDQLGERTIRRLGAAQEFESMREYVAGDDVRRIDWKASARRFRPFVRQYQTERNAEVILALDCGRLMGSLIDGVPKLDLTMTPVLDLAAVALRRKERVGLVGFDSEPRVFIPPRAGLDKLQGITLALGKLPACQEPTSFVRMVRYLDAHHRKRSLVLVFTDFTDELSAEELMAGLTSLTRRHVLIFVAVGDPHLEDLFQARTQDVRSLFEKSVAGKLLAERRRTLARIEQMGAYTLAADPQRLSGALIRRYLDVRLRGAV